MFMNNRKTDCIYFCFFTAPSRRGDLQILGFCLLHWLCGSLPWNKLVKKPTEVQEAKQRWVDVIAAWTRSSAKLRWFSVARKVVELLLEPTWLSSSCGSPSVLGLHLS